MFRLRFENSFFSYTVSFVLFSYFVFAIGILVSYHSKSLFMWNVGEYCIYIVFFNIISIISSVVFVFKKKFTFFECLISVCINCVALYLAMLSIVNRI